MKIVIPIAPITKSDRSRNPWRQGKLPPEGRFSCGIPVNDSGQASGIK